MAYTQFKTENAEYILLAGPHYCKNKSIDKLNGIDALVLEWAAELTVKTVSEGMINDLEWSKPLEYCVDQDIPVFSADCQLGLLGKLGSVLREVPSSLTLIPFLPFCIAYSFSKKEYPVWFSKTIVNLGYGNQSVLAEGRNAITARKIEEWIVPRVQKETGKTKPKIGLIYGTAHLGLEYDLKSKRRRNFTLWNMRNFNFWKWAGLGQVDDLNKIYEAKYDSIWRIIEHQTKLFD